MQGRATGRTLESLRGEHWNSTALQHTASGATAFQRGFEWPRDDLPRRLQRAPSGMTSGKTSHEDPGVEQLAGCTSTAYGHLQYANLRAFTVRKPPGQRSTTASGHLRQRSAAGGSETRGSTSHNRAAQSFTASDPQSFRVSSPGLAPSQNRARKRPPGPTAAHRGGRVAAAPAAAPAAARNSSTCDSTCGSTCSSTGGDTCDSTGGGTSGRPAATPAALRRHRRQPCGDKGGRTGDSTRATPPRQQHRLQHWRQRAKTGQAVHR